MHGAGGVTEMRTSEKKTLLLPEKRIIFLKLE